MYTINGLFQQYPDIEIIEIKLVELDEPGVSNNFQLFYILFNKEDKALWHCWVTAAGETYACNKVGDPDFPSN